MLRYVAEVAQEVEQRTENPRVAGSTPALGTIFFVAQGLAPPRSFRYDRLTTVC